MQSSPSLSDDGDNSLPNNVISRNMQGLDNLHEDVNNYGGLVDRNLQDGLPTSASKSRKRVADIWNFFTIEGGEAVCRCGRRYKHVSSYGTSTLRNHALKCPLCKDDFEELNPQKYARKSLPPNAPSMLHSLTMHAGHGASSHHNSNYDLILRQKQSLIDFLWISKTVPRVIYQPSFIQSFLASNLFHSLKNIDYFQINHYGTFLNDIQDTLVTYKHALYSFLHQPATSNHYTYYQGKYHIIVKIFTASTDKVPFVAVYLQYIAYNWQVKQLLLHVQPLANTIVTSYESFFEEIMNIVHYTVTTEWNITDNVYSIHLDNVFIPSHTIYEQYVKQVYQYFPPAAPEKATGTVTSTVSGETTSGQKRPAIWCPLSYPMMLQMIGSEVIVQLLPLLQRIQDYYLNLLVLPTANKATLSTHTLAMIQFIQSHLHFFQYASYSATKQGELGGIKKDVLQYPVNLFHQEEMMTAWMKIYNVFHQHFFYEHHPYYSGKSATATSTTPGASPTATATASTGHESLYALLSTTEYMNLFHGFYLLDVLARNVFPTASAMSMIATAGGNGAGSNSAAMNPTAAATSGHHAALNHSMKGHLVYAHVHDLYHELLRHSTTTTTTSSTASATGSPNINKEDFFATLCTYLLQEYHHYFIPYCTTTFPPENSTATTTSSTNKKRDESSNANNKPVDQLIGNMIAYDAHVYYILCHILDPRCKLKFLSSEYNNNGNGNGTNTVGEKKKASPSSQDYAHYFQSYFLTYYNIPNSTLSINTNTTATDSTVMNTTTPAKDSSSLFSNPIHSNQISLAGTNGSSSATPASIPVTTATPSGGKKWLDQIAQQVTATTPGIASTATSNTAAAAAALPATVEQEYYEMNLYLQENVFIPGHYYHPVPTVNGTSTGATTGNGHDHTASNSGTVGVVTNPWTWSTTTTASGTITNLTTASTAATATTPATTSTTASSVAGANNAAAIDKFDMLLWWSHHENKYIQLSLLVKDLLGFSTSSLSYFPPDPVTSLATAAGTILSTTTSTLAANGLLLHQQEEEIVQWLQTLSKEEVVVMMQGISWYRTLKLWQPNGITPSLAASAAAVAAAAAAVGGSGNAVGFPANAMMNM